MQPKQLPVELDDDVTGVRGLAECDRFAIPPWLEHVPDPELGLTHPSLQTVPPATA